MTHDPDIIYRFLVFILIIVVMVMGIFILFKHIFKVVSIAFDCIISSELMR